MVSVAEGRSALCRRPALLGPVPMQLLGWQSYIIFYEYINLFAIKFRLSNKIW